MEHAGTTALGDLLRRYREQRRLTQEDSIEVCGTDSSGEVEFVLIGWQGRIFVGLGSDHTDRKVESYSVTVSKQMCDKPIA